MKTDIKVLVVDDFPTMRRIVSTALNEIGFKDIETAVDGEHGWKMLKEHEFQLVITDWNMPNMSGLDLLKKIRSDGQYGKTPVLMVTAEAKKEQIVAAAKAGASGYILKPFTTDALKAKLEKIV